MRDQYRRISNRYPSYDYAQAGTVFVTICTNGRQRLFASVVDAAISLSPPGEMVHDAWHRIPERFPGVLLDEWIVMPDHVHGVLMLSADPTLPHKPATLGDIVRWFKSSTVAAYRHGVMANGWTPYDRHLWQRNYYDHIVRNNADFERIREYIASNPARWAMKYDS